MIGHYWHQYWSWAGSNIGALPAEAIITSAATLIFGLIFRKPLLRLAKWSHGWLHRERDAALAAARDDAAKARAIAADLYRHATGDEHPHAPGRG